MTKILLLDDNPHDLTCLEYQLSSISTEYKLIALTDPIEAIMRLRRNDFAMLFTNYRMSVMNGLSVARIANKVTPGICVNILANQADAIYIKSQASYVNCSNLLIKPSKISELQHILEQYRRYCELSQENMLLAERLAVLERHAGLDTSLDIRRANSI